MRVKNSSFPQSAITRDDVCTALLVTILLIGWFLVNLVTGN